MKSILNLSSMEATRQKIQFIQPRHVYAEPSEDGHIHLSAPLMMAAARLHAAVPELDFGLSDENFGPEKTGKIDADIIALNLVGAPYIPKAIEIIAKRVKFGTTVVLGGQIIDSLSDHEFERLFKIRTDVLVINGNRDAYFIEAATYGELERELYELPKKESVSQVPIWEKLDDEIMREYISREFSFYLSQGCVFRCKFCQAQNRQPEKYRDFDKARDELEYLAGKAVEFGLNKISFYISNLDGFQTPEKLLGFAALVESVKNKFGIDIEWRCLATIQFFLKAVEKNEGILEAVSSAGLKAVGFGVDGAPETWAAIGKGHNISKDDAESYQACIDAISACHKHGITPEILMVFGHPKETEETLSSALEFSREMVDQYGALPRPHVAKHIIPGTEAWRDEENADIVGQIIENPEQFQALDYTALASELSHPNPELRALTNEYYMKLCGITEGSTRYVYPNTPDTRACAEARGTTVKELNYGQFDR